MAKVFISYSRKDIDFVRKLAGDLESAGYDVWWDITDLQGGDDWVKTIPQAISSSQYVIVVLTPDSVESEWVRKEYTQALSFRKKIIPLMLVPCSVPFALNTINFVNFASGEYEDNFKKLLSPLGYTGKPPVVKPYRKPLLSRPLVKYGIPALVGLVLIFAFIIAPGFDPVEETPTVTSSPTTAAPPTDSATPEPPTATDTATVTATHTPTPTPITPTATWTASPTLARTFPLPVCIYYHHISGELVRERPNNNSGSRILGTLQRDGTNCPFFGAYIVNDENEVWYQFASNGQRTEFEQYAGRWIFGHLPPAANPVTLPLCIYNRSVASVNVLEGPSESSERRGGSLDADGGNCPFFSGSTENEGKVWYQFARDQKGVTVLFGAYADGWISGEFLALPGDFLPPSSKLPAVTLTLTPLTTPTFTPTLTPTATNTFTPTPTATATAADPPTATQTP